MRITFAFRYALVGIFRGATGWHIFPLPFVSIFIGVKASGPAPDERVVVCARSGCNLRPDQHHARKVNGVVVWTPHEFVPMVETI